MRIGQTRIARHICLATLTLLATSLTGCQMVSSSPQPTLVRFIDASPDAPLMDVYQGSTPALFNLGFGTASTYIPVAPGSYAYAADVAKTRQQLAGFTGNFTTGNQYTVLLGNIAANLQMTFVRDQTQPAPSGQVSLRFIDQTTRTGPVDVYLVPPGARLADLTATYSNLGFGGISGYLNVPGGVYSLVVLPAGTVPSSTALTLYNGSQIEYTGSTARTMVLIDRLPVTSPGLQIIPTDDYDSPAATLNDSIIAQRRRLIAQPRNNWQSRDPGENILLREMRNRNRPQPSGLFCP